MAGSESAHTLGRMKIFYKAATGAILLASSATLIAFHAHAQTPDYGTYITDAEAELASATPSDLDLALRNLSTAFHIAQQNDDAATLIRLTNDYRILLEKKAPAPGSAAESDYENDVSGAYASALDAALYEACYDPSVPTSGMNPTAGQGNLRAIIDLYKGLFGDPDPSKSGLAGVMSYAAIAAQQNLDASLAAGPGCPPNPSLSTPAPAPVVVPPPVPPPAPSPTPTNTSGGPPSPGPTNTSGPAPNPTGTSASA